MSDAIDKVAITLKLIKEVNLECYPPVKDFFNLLLKYISGEAQGQFGDVVLSYIEPSPDDVYKEWLATNAQRNDFVQKFFINGRWVVWSFEPVNSFTMFDSRAALPDGWAEVGRFKSSDIPITDTSGSGALPTEMIIARWKGF